MHLQFDYFLFSKKKKLEKKRAAKLLDGVCVVCVLCVCLLFPYYHHMNRNLRFMQIEKLLIVLSQGFVNKLMRYTNVRCYSAAHIVAVIVVVAVFGCFARVNHVDKAHQCHREEERHTLKPNRTGPLAKIDGDKKKYFQQNDSHFRTILIYQSDKQEKEWKKKINK